VLLSRNPIRVTFPACCAWAETLSAKSKAAVARQKAILFLVPPIENPKSKIQNWIT
jgi:hypothetical protein